MKEKGEDVGTEIGFGDGLESMLDELREAYDGKILSPRDRIIRVMHSARRRMNGKETRIFRAGVGVATLDDGKILPINKGDPAFGRSSIPTFASGPSGIQPGKVGSTFVGIRVLNDFLGPPCKASARSVSKSSKKPY